MRFYFLASRGVGPLVLIILAKFERGTFVPGTKVTGTNVPGTDRDIE